MDSEIGRSHVRAGARAGAALALISLAHGVNHAQNALKPLIYPLALRELGFGYADLGVVLGLASAAGGTLQLVAGALARLVRRHLLLGFGNILIGLSFLLVGLAQSFLQFSFWTVMSRLGGAAQHPVGSSLLAHHYQRRRLGLALATHFTAGNVGTAAVPLAAAFLIGLWGWRATIALFALPAILVGFAQCLWMDEPRESADPSARRSFWSDSQEALRNRTLRWVLLAAAIAAGGSGHGILSSFLPLYLSDGLGMSPARTGFVFTLVMLGSIAGPIVGGRLLDLLPARSVVLGGYALAAAATAGFFWSGHTLLLPLVALLLGTAAFGVNPILQTAVARALPDATRDLGFALFYTATFMAGALWSPIIGYLAESLGFGAPFHLMALSFLLAALCLLRAGLAEELALGEEPYHAHI